MIILGLTGSIGMGKSTVVAQFKQCGATVVDADALVHQLLSPKGAAFAAVAEVFPQAVENGQINRQILGKNVFAEDTALAVLESILHPLTFAAMVGQAQQARLLGAKIVVMEVPLLFEKGFDVLCDAVAVVTAPTFIQRQRVLKRKGMTAQKLQQILRHQLPDAEKRKRADAVIHTGLGKAHSFRQVQALLKVF
jgi:dephospho-CoA kinase